MYHARVRLRQNIEATGTKGSKGMMTTGTDCVGSCFGMPDGPCMSVVPIDDAPFTVTRIFRTLGQAEQPAVRLPPSSSYLLMVYEQDTTHADILKDGRMGPVRHFGGGTVCLIDLADGAAIRLLQDLRALAFVIPKTLLDEVQGAARHRRRAFRCRRGEEDRVMAHLATAVLPLFETGTAYRAAMLQHLALSICAHLFFETEDAMSSSADRERMH